LTDKRSQNEAIKRTRGLHGEEYHRPQRKEGWRNERGDVHAADRGGTAAYYTDSGKSKFKRGEKPDYKNKGCVGQFGRINGGDAGENPIEDRRMGTCLETVIRRARGELLRLGSQRV